MPRPVTLFTGQWADLPFEEVCRLASGWGYDGLEIACWGDHLDVKRAAHDDSYVADRLAVLEKHGLRVFAISNHLNGQAVCDDPIDERHRGMVHPRVWGDGDPEGVRQRAAEEMKLTARAAAKLGVDTVVGFTGSKIWKTVAMFPPVPESMIASHTAWPFRWLLIAQQPRPCSASRSFLACTYASSSAALATSKWSPQQAISRPS